MKITTKTTKEQLKSFLGANAKAVAEQDKDLLSQMEYASNMMKKDESKVTRKDLVDLVKSVISLLGDKVIEPALAQEAPVVAENSVKKLSKGVSKKQEVKKEESEESGEEQKEEKVEKSAKKSLGSKKAPKKEDGVTVLNESNNEKVVQLAKMFPKTITAGDQSYELASDIKNMDDLYDAISNDEEIIFAYYWTKRHFKQFPYFNGWLGQPKSFTNDLDLATAIYVSDEKKVSYQVSMYTEAIYTILPQDIEEFDDGIRYSGGTEFQIYRAVK